MSRELLFGVFGLFLLLLALRSVLGDLTRATMGPGARDVFLGNIAGDALWLVVRSTLGAFRWAVRLALLVVGTALRMLGRGAAAVWAAALQARRRRPPRALGCDWPRTRRPGGRPAGRRRAVER